MLLRSKDKETLLQIFASVEMPMEVWAYGSRVNGTAHEGSDLDLVIRTQHLQKLPMNVFAEIKEKIQESNIPILVQVFDWAALPETFHANILRQYEPLYSNLGMMVSEPSATFKKKEEKKKGQE